MNITQRCTIQECLKLCVEVDGIKACEYHENSNNCVALLDPVMANTTEGDGFGFCYNIGKQHLCKLHCYGFFDITLNIGDIRN